MQTTRIALVCFGLFFLGDVRGLNLSLFQYRQSRRKNRFAVLSPAAFKKAPKQSPLTTARRLVIPRLLEFVVASEAITHLSKSFRLNPTIVLASINVAIHAAWQGSKNSVHLDWMRLSNHFGFMLRNFCMPTDKRELAKRPQTMILSGFSHMEFGHLLSNLFLLLVLAAPVMRVLTVRQFCYFYIASQYVSSIMCLWGIDQCGTKFKSIMGIQECTITARDRLLARYLYNIQIPFRLGASGAICAVAIFRVLECPIWETLESTIDSWGRRIAFLVVFVDLFHNDGENTYREGHLAGYAAGLLFFVFSRLVRWISLS